MHTFEKLKEALFTHLDNRFKREGQKTLLIGQGKDVTCFAFTTTANLKDSARQTAFSLTAPAIGCSLGSDGERCMIHFYLGELTEENLISTIALCFEISEPVNAEMVEELFNFLDTGKTPLGLISTAH